MPGVDKTAAISSLDLLFERRRTNSKRHVRSDGRVVALVIECGGMRGAVLAGFAKAFERWGITDSIDRFYGASAGACVAAYMLSNNADDGARIYTEDICHNSVVSSAGVFRHPAFVDTDFIVDDVIRTRRPLIESRVLGSPGTLNIVTTSVMTGEAHFHKHFPDMSELLYALKVSLRLPGPREPGLLIAGVRSLDGGLSAPLPIEAAIRDGATDVLVFRTRWEQELNACLFAQRMASLALSTLYSRGLGRAYLSATKQQNQARLAIVDKAAAAITVIYPPRTIKPLDWSTTDPQTLQHAESACFQHAVKLLHNSRGNTADVDPGPLANKVNPNHQEG